MKKKTSSDKSHKLKNTLKKIPVLRSIYHRLRPANKESVGYWIRRYIPNEPIQVVQIGSNDGVSGDSLHRLVIKNEHWNVLFVEPVPELFKLLKKNYGLSRRFKFENSAINYSGKNQPFYMIGDGAYSAIPELSEDYKQIGSFSKGHVQKLSTEFLKKYIVELEVSCITFNELLKKHGIQTIQLLQIDAEGYDWKILSQLKLSEYKPLMIVFESINLEEMEKNEALEFLGKEYYIFSMGINYMCFRKDSFASSDLSTLVRLDYSFEQNN